MPQSARSSAGSRLGEGGGGGGWVPPLGQLVPGGSKGGYSPNVPYDHDHRPLVVPASPTRSTRRHIHPIIKAYGLGSLSHVTPRILALIIGAAKRKQWDQSTLEEFIDIFRKSLELHRFPAFCGITVAGSHILSAIFEAAFSVILSSKSRHDVLASFLASAVSAGAGLHMLNSKRRSKAGRTIDLTLFAVVRAADVLIGEAWYRRKERRILTGTYTRTDRIIGHMTDPVVFAISSAFIMFAWFYKPNKLPATYNRQIANMAHLDERLLILLRKIRSGEWIYGQDTGHEHILGSYAQELGLPRVWGDPARTEPVPCELIHSGESTSCEVHALRRFFFSTTKMAFPIYLTLNMLRFLRPRCPKLGDIFRALVGAARSASFLGSFVGLFWYGVCLTRTRVGPKLLKHFPGWTRLDLEKWCVHVGCVLCGWSIMLENPARRAEFMFFVAPRAMATLLPRRYDIDYQWIETIVFGLSTGVVLAAVKHNPKRVRGVFGKLLGTVLRK